MENLKKPNNMRIAIPTNNKKGLEGEIADHFGRANFYTLLNEKGGVIDIVKNESSHMGGQGLPPEFLKKHNIDILLCGDIGPRAISLCENLGISVYVERVDTVKEIFDNWKNNKLKKAGQEDACEDHKI